MCANIDNVVIASQNCSAIEQGAYTGEISAKMIASTNLSEIELPPYTYPDTWLYSLAYQQFTPEEIENGVATGIFFAREWKKKLGRFRYLL